MIVSSVMSSYETIYTVQCKLAQSMYKGKYINYRWKDWVEIINIYARAQMYINIYTQ